MLVHDMRAPMQILLGHLELMRNGLGRGMDVEAALYGATTLQSMTNSFLDVSRLEAGRMPVHRSFTDLSALAQSVVASLCRLQAMRDIAVAVHGDPVCNCDRELTRRVIEILVSNAMKHTSIEGRVRVVISHSRDRASIAVHDEGPGVLPQDRSRIFEPYSAQGLRSTMGYASSGLGLAFCRLAVEAQDGARRTSALTNLQKQLASASRRCRHVPVTIFAADPTVL